MGFGDRIEGPFTFELWDRLSVKTIDEPSAEEVTQTQLSRDRQEGREIQKSAFSEENIHAVENIPAEENIHD